jgi:CO/xanthine dehydrogenase Mo-binding subunit
MKELKTRTRREFIKVVSLSGGGLFLAAYLPAKDILVKLGEEPKIFSPSVFLKIDNKGIVTVIVHRSEMGQGVRTSLPMLVAEELEVDFKKIRIEQADGDKKYGSQTTGGSQSIRTSFEPFRIAGATAREILITAAAAKWSVQTSDCYAEKGFVINKISGKKIGYGELVEDASKLPVPQNVKLKDPKDYKVIGNRVHRTDTPEKLYGAAKFGIDVVIPGMFYAAIERCPAFGGSLKSYDDSKTRKINGVVDVIKISRGVAVIATSTWSAFKGKEALVIDWDLGPNANLDSESIHKSLQSHLNSKGTEIEVIGKPVEVEGEIIIESVYEVPFLAHAPMEPVNAIASVINGKAELWVPSQNPQDAQNQVAKILEMKPENVTIHVTLIGGAFGRKLRSDFAVEAAEIAKAFGKPIKLTWTRKDDMKHGYFRPTSMHSLKGSIADGKVIKLQHHVIAPSIRAQDSGAPKVLRDYDIAGGTTGLRYQIPYIKISGTVVNTPVPISWYRAVYGTQNPFAVESFLDELAHELKKDPYELRKELLSNDSRLKNVLETAAEKAGWFNKLSKGKGRGIACAVAYDSYCVQIAEVTVENNQLRIDRFVCAIDCGIVVNPDTVESQIEGTIAFALSAALKGEINIRKGGVVESNYDDYQILTLKEMPKVEVHIIKSTQKVGGVGELAMGTCPPALCNAIFNATGKRIRKLPIKLV